ncbi:hypothetical protein DL93DRAFT_2077609 [Clavulina sp. PMI_390]|nr:hypothetical protein DL93DRAFT_2077609 [Clavulina sp. PMI_390]
MAIDAPSSTPVAERFAFKPRKRVYNNIGDPASTAKRVKVFQDEDVSRRKSSAITTHSNTSPPQIQRPNNPLFSSSPQRSSPGPRPNPLAPKRTPAVSSPVPAKNTPSLPVGRLRDTKNATKFTFPPPLASPALPTAPPKRLASPFRSENHTTSSHKTKTPRAPSNPHSQIHSSKISNAPALKSKATVARARIKSIQDPSVANDTTKPTKRTASSNEKSARDRGRNASWLIPAAQIDLSRPRTPKKTMTGGRMRSEPEAMELDEDEPIPAPSFVPKQSSPTAMAGFSSFFANVPNAFSTPVRSHGRSSKWTGDPGERSISADRTLKAPGSASMMSSSPGLVLQGLDFGGSDPFKLPSAPNTQRPSTNGKNPPFVLPSSSHTAELQSQHAPESFPANYSPIMKSPSFLANPRPVRAMKTQPLSLADSSLAESPSNLKIATSSSAFSRLGPFTPTQSPSPQHSRRAIDNPSHTLTKKTARSAPRIEGQNADRTVRPRSPLIENGLEALSLADEMNTKPAKRFADKRRVRSEQDAESFRRDKKMVDGAEKGHVGSNLAAKKKTARRIIQSDDEHEDEDDADAKVADSEVEVSEVSEAEERLGNTKSAKGRHPVALKQNPELYTVRKTKRYTGNRSKALNNRSPSTSSTASSPAVSDRENRKRQRIQIKNAAEWMGAMDDDSDDELLLKPGESKMLYRT